MIETIMNIYLTLLEKGINVISIIIIILFTQFMKEKILVNYKLYTKKNKALINLSLGLVLSFIVSYITFSLTGYSIAGIIYTSLIASAISVYSNEIVKSVQRKLKKEDTNG